MECFYHNLYKGGFPETSLKVMFLANALWTKKSRCYVLCQESDTLWWSISAASILQKTSLASTVEDNLFSAAEQSLLDSRDDLVDSLSHDFGIGKNRNELSSWTQRGVSVSDWVAFVSHTKCIETILEENAQPRTPPTDRAASCHQKKNYSEDADGDL